MLNIDVVRRADPCTTSVVARHGNTVTECFNRSRDMQDVLELGNQKSKDSITDSQEAEAKQM